MKTGLLIKILIIVSLCSSAQDKVLTADSDTAFVFSYYNEILGKVGLNSIDKVETSYCFRLWDGRCAIEIIQEDEKLVGRVTNMVQQYAGKKDGRIYYRANLLTENTTERIRELINKYKIDSLPPQNKITNWQSEHGGITYTIEFCDKTSYTFKYYWTPSHYRDKVAEAQELSTFLSEIYSIEELNLISKNFWKKQPFSMYYSFVGGAGVVLNRD
jgi:hypothetical protein